MLERVFFWCTFKLLTRGCLKTMKTSHRGSPNFIAIRIADVQPGDRILVVYSGEAGADFVEGVTEIRLLMG